MTGTILILTCAYAAVAALLLNLNLASPHSRKLKATAIVLVSGLYAGVWHGSLGLLGWPSEAALPDAFRVYWIFLDEPGKGSDVEGGIYFWVRHLDDNRTPVGDLRSFKLAWEKDIAEYAQVALEEIEGGSPVNGFATGARGENIREGTRGTGRSDADGPMLPNPEEEELPFQFRRVPAPNLPPKGVPDF